MIQLFHWLYTFWIMSSQTSCSFCLRVWTVRSFLAASNIFLIFYIFLCQCEYWCSAGYQNMSIPYYKETIAIYISEHSLEFLLILRNSAGSDAGWWRFKYILAVSRSVNTAVLGKNLCEGLISHWLPKRCMEFHLIYAMQVTSLIKAQFFLQPVKLKTS